MEKNKTDTKELKNFGVMLEILEDVNRPWRSHQQQNDTSFDVFSIAHTKRSVAGSQFHTFGKVCVEFHGEKETTNTSACAEFVGSLKRFII